MEASAPAVATAFHLIIVGSRDDVTAALASAEPGSAAALLLTGGAAWCRGDLRRAESSLRAALAAACASERAYVADALAALLVACGRYARAAALLAGETSADTDRVALRSVVHAATGAIALSARESCDARTAARGAADDALRLRVAQRLAHAAYLRGDAAAALAEVEDGLRVASAAGTSRGAAALHAVGYAAARRLRGDADSAWRYAGELARTASAGGDAMLGELARDALCELAAERADDACAAACCGPVPGAANMPRAHVAFGLRLATALRAGGAGDFAQARGILEALEAAATRTAGERALCRALLALIAVACGDDALARRLSRRAVSTTARPDKDVSAEELRRKRLARALAATAAELAGDAARGRRAADARLLREDRTIAALWERRESAAESAFPPSVRGYARFVIAARRSVLARTAQGPLTPAEIEIVASIAAGRTVAEIAASTRRSPHTVRTHLRNASAKLDAHGRADLLAKARGAGAL